MSDRTFEFVVESNRIEGIHRAPHAWELGAHRDLWALDGMTVAALERFVEVVARKPLRRRVGQNVMVGRHVAPRGGPEIGDELRNLLDLIESGDLSPHEAHIRYEKLHPFMDGNGRSGRALWAWQMLRDGQDPFALPFLHRWYYQSLDASRAVRDD